MLDCNHRLYSILLIVFLSCGCAGGVVTPAAIPAPKTTEAADETATYEVSNGRFREGTLYMERKGPPLEAKGALVMAVVNVQSLPRIDANVVATLNAGDEVRILANSGKTECVRKMKDYWYLVERGNVKGWAYGFFLEPGTDAKVVGCERLGVVLFRDGSWVMKTHYYQSEIMARLEAYKKEDSEDVRSDGCRFRYSWDNALVDHDIVICFHTNILLCHGPEDWLTRTVMNNQGKIILSGDEAGKMKYLPKHGRIALLYDRSTVEEANDKREARYAAQIDIVDTEGKKIKSFPVREKIPGSFDYFWIDGGSQYDHLRGFAACGGDRVALTAPGFVFLVDVRDLSSRMFRYAPAGYAGGGSFEYHRIVSANERELQVEGQLANFTFDIKNGTFDFSKK